MSFPHAPSRQHAVRHLGPGWLPAALASLTLGLAGCGGGGSDGGGSTAPAGDAIDKYLATFVGNCAAEPSVIDATTKAAMNVKRTLKVATRASATSASVEVTYAYYSTADCSGSARYTTNLSGTAFSLTVDASSTVGGVSADKVTLNQGNKLPGISGGTITINGLTFANTYLQASATKDLWRLSGSDLFVGDTKALDAQGYPTALLATATYKKQ